MQVVGEIASREALRDEVARTQADIVITDACLTTTPGAPR